MIRWIRKLMTGTHPEGTSDRDRSHTRRDIDLIEAIRPYVTPERFWASYGCVVANEAARGLEKKILDEEPEL